MRPLRALFLLTFAILILAARADARQEGSGPLRIEAVMVRCEPGRAEELRAELANLPASLPASSGVLYEGTHRFATMRHDEFEIEFRAEINVPTGDATMMELEFEVEIEAKSRRDSQKIDAEFSGTFGGDVRHDFDVEVPFTISASSASALMIVSAAESGAPYDVAMVVWLHGLDGADDGAVAAGESAAVADEAAVSAAAAAEAALDERPADNPLRIIMRWQIESAVDNFGYVVYRADALDGEFLPLHRGVLPGVGTTSIPHVFRYLDTEVAGEGIPHFYKVEEIGLDGSRNFFPDPRTNEVLVLGGPPKPMSGREQQMFADGPFVIQPLER